MEDCETCSVTVTDYLFIAAEGATGLFISPIQIAIKSTLDDILRFYLHDCIKINPVISSDA